MSSLRFEVPVAASSDEVSARLERAGDRPRELVGWFTDDPAVDAEVSRSTRGWRVRVVGPSFDADVEVSVRAAAVGSVVVVDGRIAGRGLFRFATAAAAVVGPRIEREARSTLHREFGDPAGDHGQRRPS